MKHSKAFSLVALALAPTLCLAQGLAARSTVETLDQPTTPLIDLDESTSSEAAVAKAQHANSTQGSLPWTHRWLDVKTLSHAQRYRSAFDQNSYRLFGDGQQKSVAEGTVKLDAQGRYAIGFRASSGRYFNWSFADYAGEGISARTGPNSNAQASHTPAEGYEIYQAVLADPAGTITYSHLPSNGWEFYVRELYGSATPVPWATVDFGSFNIERGLSSEITTFDDDGYLTGERLRFHDAKRLYFDEVSFTNAFLGNVGEPNLFTRGLELKSSNYRQLFAMKKLTDRIAASGDYTWLIGTSSLHEAVTVGCKELHLVDKFKVEAYQRMNTITLQGLPVGGGSGFAATAETEIGSRVHFAAGFASVDGDYSVYTGSRFAHSIGFGLNGDSYSMGKRPFLDTSLRLSREITAFGFYTHHVGPRTNNLDQQNLNVGLSFDLKALINTEKAVF